MEQYRFEMGQKKTTIREAMQHRDFEHFCLENENLEVGNKHC